jgi:hypothetical protein
MISGGSIVGLGKAGGGRGRGVLCYYCYFIILFILKYLGLGLSE